jgi:excisionase family DNA binding protein
MAICGYNGCMTNPFDKAKRDEKFEGSPDDILSAAMIAELLGCRRAVLDRLCKSGELRAKRAGNKGWRTTRRAVMAYLECEAESEVPLPEKSAKSA